MFYYHELTLCTDGVYEPAEDSIMMTDALQDIDMKGKKVLDMGTGSGLLAIVAAKHGAIVTAADIDKKALETAKKNAKNNDVKIQLVCSDLFGCIDGVFDMVVFNPPYLPTDSSDSYTSKRIDYDGGKDGRAVVERFIEQAVRHLNADGKILLLISSLTGEKETIKIAENNGLKHRVVLRKKIDWEELILFEMEAY